MGLAHQFAIISQYSTESTISSDMDCVSVSDMVIQYIGDSLKWVHTMWNGKSFKKVFHTMDIQLLKTMR